MGYEDEVGDAWEEEPEAEELEGEELEGTGDWGDEEDDEVAEGVISLDPPSEEVVLPHWTEPATGEVPRVLVDEAADDERWAAFAEGPRWRDQHEGWEGDPDLTGDLTDDDHSLGALDTTERPTHEDFLTFEDLDVPEADEHTVANLGSRDPGPAVEDDLGELDEPQLPPSSGTVDDPIRIGSAPAPARPAAPGGPRGRRPEGGRPRRPEGRPGGPTRPGEPAARPRRAPAGRAPGELEADAPAGGRNVRQATAVGVGIAALAIIALRIHPVAGLVLVEAAVVLAGAEYFAALRRGGDNPPALLGLAAIAALPLAAYARGEAAIPLVLFLLLAAGVLWYVLSVGGGRPVRSLGVTLLGVLHIGMLGAFGALLLAIGPVGGAAEVDQGVSFFVLAVMAAVGYDVGGFFVGSRVGRTPLTPISPNKTLEGLVAGMGTALLALVLTHLVFGIGEIDFTQALVLGLACAIAAPIGDLAESLVKRDLAIKDMGGLLPGHGGVFDRFDGLLFVLPTAYYVVRIFFLG
jgi:phosphatidate cytidylyltransferase